MTEKRNSKFFIVGVIAVIITAGLIITASKVLISKTNAPKSEEAQFIENFYRDYFRELSANSPQRKEIPFSSAFQKIRDAETHFCQAHAPEEVCGFGVDGDIYLDAQDFEDGLSFESSNLTVKDEAPGVVVAELDVFPKEKAQSTNQHRSVKYIVIKEDGKYVVDDMFFPAGGSARSQMQATMELDTDNKPSLENQ